MLKHCGADTWPVLHDSFLALSDSRDDAVLCALVAAFPDVAVALGPALTEAEVVPVLEQLIDNHLVGCSNLQAITLMFPHALRRRWECVEVLTVVHWQVFSCMQLLATMPVTATSLCSSRTTPRYAHLCKVITSRVYY